MHQQVRKHTEVKTTHCPRDMHSEAAPPYSCASPAKQRLASNSILVVFPRCPQSSKLIAPKKRTSGDYNYSSRRWSLFTYFGRSLSQSLIASSFLRLKPSGPEMSLRPAKLSGTTFGAIARWENK